MPDRVPAWLTPSRIAWTVFAIILATGVAGGVRRGLRHAPDWDDFQREATYVWEQHRTAPSTAMFGYLPTTTFLLWPFTTWLPQPLGMILYVVSNALALIATIWIVHRWWMVPHAANASTVLAGPRIPSRSTNTEIAGPRIPSLPSDAADSHLPGPLSVSHPLHWLIWPLLLVCANFQHALQSNQLSLWTLLLCVAGLTLVERDSSDVRIREASRRRWRQWAGGLILGLVMLIKVMPALLAGYLLLRRRWRALTGIVLALVLFDAVPSAAFFGPSGAIAEHQAWLRRADWHSNRRLIADPLLRVHRHGTNASFSAVLARWLRPLPDARRQVILYGDPPPEVIEEYRAELAPDEVLTLDPMPPEHGAWAEKRVLLDWVPRFHIAELSAATVWWTWATALALGGLALAWFTWRSVRGGTDWRPVAALWLLAMFWPSPMMRHYYLAWAFPAITVVWQAVAKRIRPSDSGRTTRPRTTGRRWTAGSCLAVIALAAWAVGVFGLGWSLGRWYGLHLLVLALLTAATAWAWRAAAPSASHGAGRSEGRAPTL